MRTALAFWLLLISACGACGAPSKEAPSAEKKAPSVMEEARAKRIAALKEAKANPPAPPEPSKLEIAATRAAILEKMAKIKSLPRVSTESLLKQLDARTTPVLINIWATWCGPCVEEWPELIELAQNPEGLEVWALSVDAPSHRPKIAPFLDELPGKMKVMVWEGSDQDTLIKALNSQWEGTLPVSYLYWGTGSRRRVFLGPITAKGVIKVLKEAKPPM